MEYSHFPNIRAKWNIQQLPLPDVLASVVVSPGLVLPGLLPKMDFLLFLSFPLPDPQGFNVVRPVPIKLRLMNQTSRPRGHDIFRSLFR